jgi:hypothetical protein
VSRVRVEWLIAGLVAGSMGAADSPPSQKAVMARAGAFIVRYVEELPQLVATESSVQDLTPQRGHATGVAAQRRLVAEFAWVKLPGEAEPIGFRDVIEVDGWPAGPDRRRLVDLLHGPGRATWAQARTVLEEGARHNLAPGSRNFNLPTVAAFFLHPERQKRFSWKRRSDARAPAWELEYRERDRPTLIRHGDGQSIFSRGRVWIDAASGAVLRTDLVLELDTFAYQLTTRFERVAAMDLVLPVQLAERYTTPEDVVTGSATYTNYRRFQTGARLIR